MRVSSRFLEILRLRLQMEPVGLNKKEPINRLRKGGPAPII